MTPHNEVEGGHRLGVVVDIIVIAHVDHLSTSALLNESLDRQHITRVGATVKLLPIIDRLLASA